MVYFHAAGRASSRAAMLRRMSAHFPFPAQIDLGQPLQGDTARLQARLQAAGLQVHQPSPPINVAPTVVLEGRHPLLDAQARFTLAVRLPPVAHAKTAR